MDDLTNLWEGNVRYPDVLCLQELGGVRDVTSDVTSREHCFGSTSYNMYVCSADEAFRCQAILVRSGVGLTVSNSCSLKAGLVLHVACPRHRMHFACLHLPHSKRTGGPNNPRGDAETVWKDTLEGLDLELAPANPEDVIMIGADVNQDLRAVVDEFSGVGHLRALIAKYDLVYNRSLGATWSARGCESEIDFVMVRAARISLAAHKREDMRDALPSDHSPVFAVLHTPLPLVTRSQRPITKCGRWLVDGLVLQAYAEEGKPFEPEEFKNLCASHARRLPSLRYRDSQELKATIALRRQETDTQVKAALLQRIRHERAVAKNEHRIRILEEARGGDRRAISYLRKSAAHASFEVSYIQQRGGELAASQELQAFYEAKYTSFLPAPTEDSINTMIATHQFVQPRRFTQDELEAAIERCKARTSAGMDGVCYEAIKAYHRGDVEGRLLEFFNGLLFRKVPVPDDWKRAKVVLLPKTPKPAGPQDLRPICLSPCLSKIWGRLLMLRISEQCPPFQSGQLGCRKGTQTVDGVLAAQTVIGVLRKKHGVEAHAAKLDIRAAFDSLSHSALVQYIMACKPCPEACHLWDLCSANTLHMSLGAASWEVNVHQGILQGSSYSADVFARVIDYHLRGLHERWNSKFPKWDDGVGLPHFLLYADDLLVFAMSPAELQSKLHDITDSLQAIGLFINAGKCSVLNVQGSTPGVWTRNSCRPLAGKDSLVFLGVPLSHTNNPDTMLMHSLRKMTNSYFAMKKVLDHATTSHRVRSVLFDSYISSTWAWCSSVVWPTTRSIRSLEGLKNSLLLGVYRFAPDPFSTWIENTQACRRALRLYCDRF